MKRLLVLLAILLILLGIPYGLAKMGIIPVAKLCAKNPALAKFARSVGLMPRRQTVQASTKEQGAVSATPSVPASSKTVRPEPAPLPPVPPAAPSAANTPDDPSHQVGWVAKVYENMEPEQAVRILEKMNDREVIALLRRMKQRQVAQILALLPPDRAARLSRSLMIQR